MAVNVQEVPLEPNDDVSPAPIYKSEHIHVYGLPMLSSQNVAQSEPETSSPESTADGSNASLKRKRDISPHLPQKRTATSVLTEDNISNLEELRKNPNFSPSLLDGDVAQEWRRLVVTSMFPAKEAETKKSSRSKEESQIENDQGLSHVPICSQYIYTLCYS